MQDSIHPPRPVRSPRRLLAAAALVSGALVAGCGSSGPTVATAGSTTTSTSHTASAGAATSSRTNATASSRSHTTTGAGAAASGSPAAGNLQSQELAYAKCMRANGVPAFPDPNPGGGFNILVQPGGLRGSGLDPASPLYKAANAKCQTLLPNAGAGPTYSAQAGVQLLTIAKCMRRHGIADFPDPVRAQTGALPPPKPGFSRVTNYQGWLLEYPATINMQSPSYAQAAAACGAQFLNTPQ